MLVDRRRQEQRRVGDAAGDDDVGADRERRQQRIDAEIGIGGDQPTVSRQRLARLQRGRAGSIRSNTSSPVTTATLMSQLRRLAIATMHDRAAATGFAAPMLVISRTRLLLSTGSSSSMRRSSSTS